jgi:hypothetical protein
LNPTVGGLPPVVEYGFPGGTSLRVLRHPGPLTITANIRAKHPPGKTRLGRSID